MGHPPVLTVVKELEQVAGTVTHLYIILRGAPILAERIHETRQQVEIVRLQHPIEVLAVKAVEIRRVLHVERKPVGAGGNVDDVGGEIRDLDELLVPGPLFELACSGEPIGLEVLPKRARELVGFDRQFDIRVQLGLDEPETPDVEFKEFVRGSILVRQDLLNVIFRRIIELTADAICVIGAVRYRFRSRVLCRI